MTAQFVAVAAAVKAAYGIYNMLNSLFTSNKEVTWLPPHDLVQEIRNLSFHIEACRSAIISEIQEMRLAQLSGDVTGLADRFKEYTVYDKETQYDQWVSEGGRLRELIDDAANTLGQLDHELNRLDLKQIANMEYGAKVFSVFAIAIPLRATAMLERARHYQTQDANHIHDMHKRLHNQVDRLIPELRSHSDRRFSAVMTRPAEPGYWQVYYRFHGKLQFGHEVPKPQLPAAIKLVEQHLELRKQIMFSSYLCIPVIEALNIQAIA